MFEKAGGKLDECAFCGLKGRKLLTKTHIIPVSLYSGDVDVLGITTKNPSNSSKLEFRNNGLGGVHDKFFYANCNSLLGYHDGIFAKFWKEFICHFSRFENHENFKSLPLSLIDMDIDILVSLFKSIMAWAFKANPDLKDKYPEIKNLLSRVMRCTTSMVCLLAS